MSEEQDPRRGLPSCSEFYRLEKCPASWNLGKLAKAASCVPESGPDANSGTLIHRYLETGDDADWLALDPGQRETALICERQRIQVIADWIAPGGLDAKHVKERRLGMTVLGGVVEVADGPTLAITFTGMADLVVFDRVNKRALIIDYKSGWGETPEAAVNAQLRGLAVLVGRYHYINDVRVAIVKPSAGKPTVADYDAGLLESSRSMIDWMLARAESGKGMNAGDHCQYCPARCFDKDNPDAGVCPGLRDKATDLPLEVVGDGAMSGPAMIAKAMNLPAATLSKSLNGMKVIGYYLKALNAAARMRLENGETIPGWELEESDGNRKIEDTGKASKALTPYLASAEGGVAAALLRCAKLSAPALQEELRKASGKKSEKRFNLTHEDAKQHLANILGDLMTVPKTRQLVQVGHKLEGGSDD